MRLGSPSTSRLKQLTVYIPVVLLTGYLLKHFETRSRSLIAWSLDRPLPKFLIAWFTVIQREKKIIVLPWRLQSIIFAIRKSPWSFDCLKCWLLDSILILFANIFTGDVWWPLDSLKNRWDILHVLTSFTGPCLHTKKKKKNCQHTWIKSSFRLHTFNNTHVQKADHLQFN